MGRRHHRTAMDDMLDIASRLPWWLGIVLALISYVVLSSMVARPVVQDASPGHVSGLVVATLISTFAQIGQYLLPAIFLIGALVSLLRSKKSEKLMMAATGNDATGAVANMSWREFEMLMAEAFRLQGFSVKDLGGQGPDGGIDLVLTKGSERHLVQCKQWRAMKVGVAVVRELYGVMSAEGATGGFVVTSGTFTQDAAEFAQGRNVRLIDGVQLLGLLDAAKNKGTPAKATQAHENGNGSSKRLSPVCPKCNADMKLRQARKGQHAGNEFWGCTRFPDCRGTLPIERL